MPRTYTQEQRAEVVGLAASVGVTKAAERYGVPLTTAARWMTRTDLAPVRDLTRKAVAAKLWAAVVTGVDEVVAGLTDPKARLGDKARALEVVAAQHALLTGGPTSRTSVMDGGPEPPALSLTPDELDGLAAWLEKQMAAGVPTDELVAQYAALPEPPQLTAGKDSPDVV